MSDSTPEKDPKTWVTLESWLSGAPHKDGQLPSRPAASRGDLDDLVKELLCAPHDSIINRLDLAFLEAMLGQGIPGLTPEQTMHLEEIHRINHGLKRMEERQEADQVLAKLYAVDLDPVRPVERSTANQSVDERACIAWLSLSKKNGERPSIADVADQIGQHRENLYRCEDFMLLVNADKQSRDDRKKRMSKSTKDRSRRVGLFDDNDTDL